MLPTGWERATVGDVAQYINGAAFSPTDWSPRGTPIVRIQNLTDPDKPINRTQRRVSPCLLIQQGDLLFSWSATLDAFIWHGEPAWLNQHIFKVLPEAGITNRFAFYLLRHTVREITRSEHMHGSTMQHINRGPFLAYPILLPPLAEQQRIADALDELLSDLDAGVTALESVRAKLRQYRAAMLKAAVEGTLTAEWRKSHPDVEPASELLKRILAERRRRWEEAQLKKYKDAGKDLPKDWKAKYKEPAALHTGNLQSLPDGWRWTTVEQAGDVRLGRQRAPQHHSGDHMRPYLRVANVYEARLDLTDVKEMNFTPDEFETYALQYGDILLNEGQSPELVGRPAMYRDEVLGCCYQKTLLRFRAAKGVSPNWALAVFRSYLHSGRFRRNANITTSIAHLAAERFAPLEFPLPPDFEQGAIVEAVEEQLSVIEHLESDLEAKLNSAQALRQSVLKAAFEGKLVSQDPNDEPASALLKRIAAERVERERLAKQAKKPARPGTVRAPRRRQNANAASAA
jgi:type I restriction enzyme S subunit